MEIIVTIVSNCFEIPFNRPSVIIIKFISLRNVITRITVEEGANENAPAVMQRFVQ